MYQGLKIAVLSGVNTNVGKTAFVDNCIATRLPNLVRLEIEDISTGSRKPGIIKLRGDEIPRLREALSVVKKNNTNLVCDVGGSEYGRFLSELKLAPSTASRFDHFVFLMRSGIKQSDATGVVEELIRLAVPPEKISVLFGMAPYQPNLRQIQEKLEITFRHVYETAKDLGYHICKTPVVSIPDLYTFLSGEPDLTVDGLVAAKNFDDEVVKLEDEGKDVPIRLSVMAMVQENARTFAKANMDEIWNELSTAINLNNNVKQTVEVNK
jgi:hypothetical protein